MCNRLFMVLRMCLGTLRSGVPPSAFPPVAHLTCNSPAPGPNPCSAGFCSFSRSTFPGWRGRRPNHTQGPAGPQRPASSGHLELVSLRDQICTSDDPTAFFPQTASPDGNKAQNLILLPGPRTWISPSPTLLEKVHHRPADRRVAPPIHFAVAPFLRRAAEATRESEVEFDAVLLPVAFGHCRVPGPPSTFLRLFRATTPANQHDGFEAASTTSVLTQRRVTVWSTVFHPGTDHGRISATVCVNSFVASPLRRRARALAQTVRSAVILPSEPTIPPRTRCWADAQLDPFATSKYILDHVRSNDDAWHAAAQLAAPTATTTTGSRPK